jgi:parvulin-like peptidyl-prolyl isomerase
VSISKFQQKLFNKGCGTAILIGSAATFGAICFSYYGRGSQPGGGENGEQTGKVIATLAGAPITTSLVDQLVLQQQNSQDQPGQPPMPVTPTSEASKYGTALDDLLQHAAITAVAKSQGVQFTDDELRDAAKSQLQQQLEMTKFQAEMGKQLKPGATDADFDAMIKKRYGASVEDIEKRTLSNLDADLKDPAKRADEVGQLGEPILAAAMGAKIKVSDADLKASYDSDTFKRILLTEKPPPSPSIDVRLAQVQKDLASGTSFEKAMDRYSDETPLPKKKVSENQQVLSLDQLTADPAMAPLKSLKVGQVSDPIKSVDGVSIYKLISVKNQAPPDFDKSIAKYRQQFQQRMAENEVQSDIKTLISSKTDWSSAGYKAIYDVTRPNIDPSKASALYDEAKAAIKKTEGYDLRPAQLAEYVAFDMIWNAAGADKNKLRPERIQVLNDYLGNMESFSVRMELVQLYEADKNGSLASASLIAAAKANNTYDAAGQGQFGDVAAAVLRLKSAGILSPSDEKAIQDVQAQWKSDKADSDTEQAKEKADQAKAMAEEEADRKKAEAEAKKAAKETPSVKIQSAPGATPGSITGPPTSSSAVPPSTGLYPSPSSPPAGTAGTPPGGKKG